MDLLTVWDDDDSDAQARVDKLKQRWRNLVSELKADEENGKLEEFLQKMEKRMAAPAAGSAAASAAGAPTTNIGPAPRTAAPKTTGIRAAPTSFPKNPIFSPPNSADWPALS